MRRCGSGRTEPAPPDRFRFGRATPAKTSTTAVSLRVALPNGWPAVSAACGAPPGGRWVDEDPVHPTGVDGAVRFPGGRPRSHLPHIHITGPFGDPDRPRFHPSGPQPGDIALGARGVAHAHRQHRSRCVPASGSAPSVPATRDPSGAAGTAANNGKIMSPQWQCHLGRFRSEWGFGRPRPTWPPTADRAARPGSRRAPPARWWPSRCRTHAPPRAALDCDTTLRRNIAGTPRRDDAVTAAGRSPK